MLISHRKKFIYTKTVKTAGTSVESYFEKYCLPEGEWEFTHQREQSVCNEGVIGYRGANAGSHEWYNHMSANQIRNKIDTEVWGSFFKFCVVRNPFDKLVSLYFFQREKGFPGIDSNEDPIEGFRKWIGKGIPVPDRKQYMINGTVCMDYFIKFEDINNGIKFVCDRLSLPFDADRVPRLKSDSRDRSFVLADFYSRDIARLVNKAYEFEMGQFEYSIHQLP